MTIEEITISIPSAKSSYNKSSSVGLKDEIIDIKQKIKKATLDGKYYVHIDGSLRNPIKEALERLGYIVNYASDPRSLGSTEILWKHIGDNDDDE